MATRKTNGSRDEKKEPATHFTDEEFYSALPVGGEGHQSRPNSAQIGPRQRSYPSHSVRMPDICPSHNAKGGCNMPRGRCMQLHICQHFINGVCKFGEQCFKSHNIFDAQPKSVLQMCGVNVMRSSNEVLTELRRFHATGPNGKTSEKMPDVCHLYNVKSGCTKGNSCTRLHICQHYISGGCKFGKKCKRSHNIFDSQPKEALKKWGINVARSPKIVLDELRRSAPAPTEDVPQASGGVDTPVTPQSKEGEEICIYHLRGRCHYNKSCRNHHCSLPYQWQMQQTDGTWTDFSPSDNITCELMFCDKEDTWCLVLPSNTNYKVDLDKFTITEGANKYLMRRLSTTSSMDRNTSYHTFATRWCWYWQNNDNEWEPFLKQGNLHLPQTSVTSEDLENIYKESPKGDMTYSANKWQYKVDFAKMCQYNLTTGRARQLRRRPEFVSQEAFEKLKSTPVKRSASGTDAVTSLPPQWDLTDMDGDFQLVKLARQSHADEWGTIEKRFQESMPARQIKSVQRIQNMELWDNYSRKKHRMEKRSGANVRELLLFHGTAGQYVDPICQQGFDFRLNGLSAGTKYGKGSYFAKNARYSRKYTNDRRLFVVQVLVGEFCAGCKTLVRPPPKDDAEPFGATYDSCVDKVNNPEIFVIFSNDQAYPAYLIEYEPVTV